MQRSSLATFKVPLVSEDARGVTLPTAAAPAAARPSAIAQLEDADAQLDTEWPCSSSYESIAIDLSPGSPIWPFDGDTPRVAEQYRLLRTNLLHHAEKPRVIGITSACPNDGKTFTAINTAGAFAITGQSKILLIDADLRHRSLSGVLGLDGRRGLSDVLARRASLAEAIVQISQYPQLHVLPAGNIAKNPAELLVTQLFEQTIEHLREEFEYLIVDTTPIAAVADFQLVEKQCEGLLLVVRPDSTSRATLTRLMQTERFPLLGVVLNGVQDWILYDVNDHYAYYSTPVEVAKQTGPIKWWRKLRGRLP